MRAEQEKQLKQGKKEKDAGKGGRERESEICWLEGTDNTCATIIQRPPENTVEMDQEETEERVGNYPSIIQ